MKVPPPNRRHEFRYAKCARQTFMCGGASAAGRMKVYYLKLKESYFDEDAIVLQESMQGGML